MDFQLMARRGRRLFGALVATGCVATLGCGGDEPVAETVREPGWNLSERAEPSGASRQPT